MRTGRVGAIEGFHEGEIRRQASATVAVSTPGQGFTDITDAVAEFVRVRGIANGLVTVFCRHTSASLTIQENADPDVRTDLMTALDHLAPRHGASVRGIEGPDAVHGRPAYMHSAEGPDDMPAHIRTALTDSSLSIPVVGGRLALGTWQGIYLIEHRDRPHRREVILHIIGA